MAADPRSYAATVLAALCIERVFEKRRLGVFIENVPPINAEGFVQEIGRLAPRPVRVALLGTKTRPRGSANVKVTTDPNEANEWRNDSLAREGVPGIFIVLGPSPKLNSLRTAVPILTAAEVRDAAVKKCLAAHHDKERESLLRAIASLSGEISTDALMRFGAEVEAVSKKGKSALLAVELDQLRILGLLPSNKLTSVASVGAARRVVQKNLEFIASLRRLPKKAHNRLAALIEGKHEVASRAEALLKFSRTGRLEDLGSLALEEAEEALKAELPGAETSGSKDHGRTRPKRIEGDGLVLDLVFEDGGRGLKVASQRYSDAIAPPSEEEGQSVEEFTVNRKPVIPRLRVGSTQATEFFSRLLSNDVWGGVVIPHERTDFVGAQKLLASGDAEIEEFRPATDKGVRGTLKRAVDLSLIPVESLSNWDRYAQARSALLDGHIQGLIDHPLLTIMGDEQVALKCRSVVDTYSRVIDDAKSAAKVLIDAQSQDAAKRVIARLLSLDIAFVRLGDEFTALAAPTHPFHLWRWLALADLLEHHREELEAIGVEHLEPLVADPLAACPQIVLSPFALTQILDRPRALVASGSFGSLPLFMEPTSRQSGKFRARSFVKIAERLIRLMPHAALGLRVSLVDPPSVTGAIEDLLDLTNPLDDETDVPLHIAIIRTRETPEATDEEEFELTNLAREVSEGEGTLAVVQIPELSSDPLAKVSEYLQGHPAHIVVVFDPGTGERIGISPATRPTLSPLVVPRAYKYDQFDDRLDLVVSGDAAPFSVYNEMFCDALGIPRQDLVGRRSGALQSRRQLEAIARWSTWTVIVDQAVEPTLHLTGTDRIDWRIDGGRDVVTFTAHPQSIETLIADTIRISGLLPDEETRKRTLTELFALSGEAVLSLIRAKPSTSLAEPRYAKGTIGVLSSVRWYERHHPDALIISLDDPTSRQWILGIGSDDRHGDLLVVRRETDGVHVEALEVKSHDSETAGVRTRGSSIEGKAVVQIDQTIETLKKILRVPVESPVLRARQEILRDQLYRAVASRAYSPDIRSRHVRVLEELFAQGPTSISGIIFKVRIASGEESIDPSSPDYKRSEAGNRIGLIELVEVGGRPHASVGAEQSPRVAAQPPPDQMPESGRKKGLEVDKTMTRPTVEQRGHLEEIVVHVGESATGDDVSWRPNLDSKPLNNFGFLVTGDPGTGKTQIIRAIIAEACERKLPVCAFDFKNDYADDAFASRHGLTVHDVNRYGLPFNPLQLVGDDRGEVRPISQIHELSEILRRIYGFSSSRQSAQLRKAMVSAYENHGIRVNDWQKISEIRSYPDFDEVKSIMGADDKNDGLLDRLSPLFDLNLFPSARKSGRTFDQFIQERVVLDMHRLPNDLVKAALSEFTIVALHGLILKGDQPRRLRRLLVFDEAWRVKDSIRLQELAREGRAFGVGIMVGTQFPGDIPDDLAGTLATQLMLSNQSVDHRRSVLLKLIGTTSGIEAQRLLKQLAQLQKHEGYFRNQQYTPYVFVKSKPYYERIGE